MTGKVFSASRKRFRRGGSPHFMSLLGRQEPIEEDASEAINDRDARPGLAASRVPVALRLLLFVVVPVLLLPLAEPPAAEREDPLVAGS